MNKKLNMIDLKFVININVKTKVTAYNYVSYVIKHMQKISDKNISNKKYEKLENGLFRMGEFNQIVPGKGQL